MKTYVKRIVRNFDFPLFFVYLVLCLFGLVAIYSSSMVWAVNKYGFEPDHFYIRQQRNLAIAVPAFLLAAFFPYKNYKRKGLMVSALIAMFSLLVLVHFIGFGQDVG